MFHVKKAGAVLALPLVLCALTPAAAWAQDSANAANTNQAPYDNSILMRNNTAEVEGHVTRAIAILDQINQLIDGINARHAAAGQAPPPAQPEQPQQ